MNKIYSNFLSKNVGVSGTRNGMTVEQKKIFFSLLIATTSERDILRHGDCIGVDKEAHNIAKYLKRNVIIHPPAIDKYRAFCETDEGDEILEPKQYLDRNWDIIKSSEIIFIIPKEFQEQYEGSGTWASFRYAKKLNKKNYIIFPDGSYSYGEGDSEIREMSLNCLFNRSD